MYIECQNCSHRQGNKCDIDGEYAEPNHIYASDSHCQKDKQLDCVFYGRRNVIGRSN